MHTSINLFVISWLYLLMVPSCVFPFLVSLRFLFHFRFFYESPNYSVFPFFKATKQSRKNFGTSFICDQNTVRFTLVVCCSRYIAFRNRRFFKSYNLFLLSSQVDFLLLKGQVISILRFFF